MKIIKTGKENFEKAVNMAAGAIREGKAVVGPSDTVYGIYAEARNEEAVKRIFKIKKRLKGKPIAIFVKDVNTAKKFARISQKQEAILKRLWPGKTTFILKAKKELPYISFKNTIGTRVPSSKFLLSLLKKIDMPLAQTSANISGKPATTEIKKVINYFKNQKYQPDLILDEGNLKPAQPSTVIDLTGPKPEIIRKGKDLENILSIL